MLQKVKTGSVEEIVVAHIWPTQPWFPQLLQLIVENSYLLPNNPDILRLQSQPDKVHPIPKMRLGVSGNRLKTEAYRKTLSKYSSPRGGNQQRNSIEHINKNGCFFCQQKQIDIFNTNVNCVLEFLTRLFKSGLGYSALNTARSALSSFLQLANSVNIGSDPLVFRFLRGLFIMRPALPRYNVTWNVDIVLNYFQT